MSGHASSHQGIPRVWSLNSLHYIINFICARSFCEDHCSKIGLVYNSRKSSSDWVQTQDLCYVPEFQPQTLSCLSCGFPSRNLHTFHQLTSTHTARQGSYHLRLPGSCNMLVSHWVFHTITLHSTCLKAWVLSGGSTAAHLCMTSTWGNGQ